MRMWKGGYHVERLGTQGQLGACALGRRLIYFTVVTVMNVLNLPELPFAPVEEEVQSRTPAPAVRPTLLQLKRSENQERMRGMRVQPQAHGPGPPRLRHQLNVEQSYSIILTGMIDWWPTSATTAQHHGKATSHQRRQVS
jgi:hypothetical protein